MAQYALYRFVEHHLAVCRFAAYQIGLYRFSAWSVSQRFLPGVRAPPAGHVIGRSQPNSFHSSSASDMPQARHAAAARLPHIRAGDMCGIGLTNASTKSATLCHGRHGETTLDSDSACCLDLVGGRVSSLGQLYTTGTLACIARLSTSFSLLYTHGTAPSPPPAPPNHQ